MKKTFADCPEKLICGDSKVLGYSEGRPQRTAQGARRIPTLNIVFARFRQSSPQIR